MSVLLDRLRRIARAMVGMPDYDRYVRHMRDHHPHQPPMNHIQFFRNRQAARYGSRGGGRCC
jgi:uncharacterized short protein YbdD (DUF466 family)